MGEGRPLSPPDRPPESPRSSCSGRSVGLIRPESSAGISPSPSWITSPRDDRPEGGRPWRRRSLEGAAGTSSPSAMLSEIAPSRRRALSQPGARAQGGAGRGGLLPEAAGYKVFIKTLFKEQREKMQPS